MPFSIIEGDISKVAADAVVNAANEQLMAGGGVCGAIFAGAGFEQMQAACDAIGHCPTGNAVVTPGFGLPAKHVIHAVGPVWRGGGHDEEALLRSAYRRALMRAVEIGARSVAFPLISAGIYGYPQDAARAVATSEIRAFLASHDELAVYLVLYNRARFAQTLARYQDVAGFVDAVARRTQGIGAGAARSAAMAAYEAGNFVENAPARSCDAEEAPLAPQAAPAPAAASLRPSAHDLTWRLEHLDASFSATVLSLIDERGLTDAQVYKRANLSRQVFSKLRRDDGYRPAKQTAVALALALELDLDQTEDLLQRAGYALSRTNKFDIIVEYYIERGCCDVFEVNEMLFAFDQPLLGSL